MHRIPDELTTGPFTRAMAREAGLSNRVLQGRRFIRIYPCVWRLADHEMTPEDWCAAALMALPDGVHITGISRIQALGLDFGPRLPVRCVVQGPLHLVFDHVFLHRTKLLPPLDEVGVSVEAAFIFYCVQARVVDAIKVGDWLLHHGHMTLEKLRELAIEQLWRPGADEALWIMQHLEGRSRSLKESELRAILRFAGLPDPEVNIAVDVDGAAHVIGDLVYRAWRTVVEYEGTQHQVDRAQYVADLDRYGIFRDHEHRYVQVTQEHLNQPKVAVRRVHRALVKAGYDGPAPVFGEQWRLLFLPLRIAVGPRIQWRASS